MHATYPHPRRALVAAVAALALAMLALVPAALGDLSLSLGGDGGSAPAQAPASAPATMVDEPSWQDNPFAWPLLQAPAR
jgi:hypothetical protein